VTKNGRVKEGGGKEKRNIPSDLQKIRRGVSEAVLKEMGRKGRSQIVGRDDELSYIVDNKGEHVFRSRGDCQRMFLDNGGSVLW